MDDIEVDNKYTAIVVGDLLAEQQNLAANAGDTASAQVIWTLLTTWAEKNK